MRGISHALVDNKSCSSIARFLTSGAWENGEIIGKYMGKIRHLFHGKYVSLIIDDSTAKKTGKQIAEAQYHKDHAKKGYVFGHQVVTALLQAGDILLPLVPLLYSRKTVTKIQLAIQQIHLALKYVNVREVIMDSWYMAAEIIHLCTSKGITVIGAVKSNRIIYVNGMPRQLKSYRRGLKRKDWTMMIIDEEKYLVHECIFMMKNIGRIKLLLCKQCHDGKWSRVFYLVSTDNCRSSVSIIRAYSRRWSIEIFHKDIKSHLGLEACQARRYQSIIRHLMLVTLAYACLKLWMLWNKVFKTIGEVIDVVQGNAYGDLIVTIVEEPSYKKRMALAEPYLNKIAQVQFIRLSYLLASSKNSLPLRLAASKSSLNLVKADIPRKGLPPLSAGLGELLEFDLWLLTYSS